ncbi:hypothetical protein Tco_1517817 [Tanacetum coccineum]
MIKFYNLCTDLVDFTDMETLPPRDQRHLWLRYQVEGYTDEIVHDFEQRLEMIFGRQVNRVHILDFEGLTSDMRQDLAERPRMVYTRDDGQEVFVSHAWRRLFEIRAPLDPSTFSSALAGSVVRWGDGKDGFRAYWLGSERVIPNKGDLSDYWVEISCDRDFLRGSPSYTYIRDPVRRLCHRQAEGRKSSARLSGGYFIRRLAHHFGLVNDERQPDTAAGAPRAAEDAPGVDEGAQAGPAHVQAPRPLPPLPDVGRTMP